MTEAVKEYAQRVWAGQSVSAPIDWRVMRVGQALAGQGWELGASEFLPEYLVDELTMATALKAFAAARGKPIADKVAAVDKSLAGVGVPLTRVFDTSQRYWEVQG